MRRFTKGSKGWFLPAVILAGCLATGCGSTASSAIGTLSSKAATITATPPAGAADASTPAVTSTATATETATATATSTATVTATATPTAPAASPTAAATGSSSLLWLWILLGVAALAGLTAWIVHASHRRSTAAADWQSRLIDVYAKGSALHDAMSVAEAPGGYAAQDAAGRWADIQRRADDLTQELYSLREAVPDDGDRARIADTLASLQAARSAMDAERAPGGAGPGQAEVVRGRLYSFEMSLRALRSGDAEYR
jgi:outer membrane murein-binding lipoprotein Lpp